MTHLSADGGTVIVNKSGLRSSFSFADAKGLTKTDFTKKYKKALIGYTEQVYDELQVLKKGAK